MEDDQAISAIKALKVSGKRPSYAWLRREFGAVQISENVWRSLDRGRAVLHTVQQLDQYLFSYSRMIASQWDFALKQLNIDPRDHDSRIVDYGCGQGLAGLLMSDHFGPKFFEALLLVVAIEPSAVALRRAVALYQALAPHALVTPVSKSFDALTADDIAANEGPTIHLFSNVLDIDGYDHVALLRKGLTRGEHKIIAVGHDRTMHGYSLGLQRVKDAVDSGAIRSGVTVHASGLESFACGNKGEPAVLWLCKLEVRDG